MSSPTSTVTPLHSPQGPFEAALFSAIRKLSQIKAPGGFSNFPHPMEFSTVADFMRDVAGVVDEMYAACGHQVADNASIKVDMRDFLSPCTDGIDGALYEVEKSREALIAEFDEMARAS